MNARLNWILFAAVLLLIGGNVLLFGGIPRWLTAAPASAPPSDNEPSCLKVSDFYSVHLTTFFLAADENGGDPKGKTKRYMPYCDRIPRNRAGNFHDRSHGAGCARPRRGDFVLEI